MILRRRDDIVIEPSVEKLVGPLDRATQTRCHEVCVDSGENPNMTKEETVSRAQKYVANQYPMVPPIGGIFPYSVRQIGARERVRVEGWMHNGRSKELQHSVGLLDLADLKDVPSQEIDLAKSGYWMVSFFMNWDTDALGMPPVLNLIVCDRDGGVSEMPRE
jgi:hypothetical protein